MWLPPLRWKVPSLSTTDKRYVDWCYSSVVAGLSHSQRGVALRGGQCVARFSRGCQQGRTRRRRVWRQNAREWARCDLHLCGPLCSLAARRGPSSASRTTSPLTPRRAGLRRTAFARIAGDASTTSSVRLCAFRRAVRSPSACRLQQRSRCGWRGLLELGSGAPDRQGSRFRQRQRAQLAGARGGQLRRVSKQGCFCRPEFSVLPTYRCVLRDCRKKAGSAIGVILFIVSMKEARAHTCTIVFSSLYACRCHRVS